MTLNEHVRSLKVFGRYTTHVSTLPEILHINITTLLTSQFNFVLVRFRCNEMWHYTCKGKCTVQV